MDSIKLRLNITNDSRHADLGIELWLDQDKFFDQNISPGTHHVIHEFPDTGTDHQLKFVLKNKQDFHTKIDDQGHILEDAVITIDHIEFNDIEADELIFKMARYFHDSNGNGDSQVDKFFGTIGCNGEVRVEFTSPFYLWLLENM